MLVGFVDSTHATFEKLAVLKTGVVLSLTHQRPIMDSSSRAGLTNGCEEPRLLAPTQWRPTMFRVDAGLSPKYCDGLNRRSFVQLGVAGMASVGLGDILRAKAASANEGRSQKQTSAILIWLDGGP